MILENYYSTLMTQNAIQILRVSKITVQLKVRVKSRKRDSQGVLK